MAGRVLIVGGGVSGLSLAYFLNKVAPKLPILLVESDSNVGGWYAFQMFVPTWSHHTTWAIPCSLRQNI